MSPARRRAPAIRPVARALAGVAVLAIGGCGRDGAVEITQIRERPADDAPAPLATITQRFGPEPSSAGGDPHVGGRADAAPAPAWTWATPEGWRELGPAPMRVTAWGVAVDAECSFATLPSSGAGLAANVDRWRRQMTLPPAGDAGVAALPRHRMLGRDALRVELSGTFVGMGGTKSLPGAKLLGLVVEMPAFTAFLKLTGPAAVVEAETPRFLALAASITPSPGFGAPSAAPAGPDRTLAPFGWTAPEDWVRGPAKSMRLATFVPSGAPGTEIYLTLLSGRAGGTRMNLDRWRGQMGAEPLTDAEFEALPRKAILGGTAIFLATDGIDAGMPGAGGAPAAGAAGPRRLVGMALERANDMVFVKMTGPAAEVRREEARFQAFCESFHD